jgi:hypothetical protein
LDFPPAPKLRIDGKLDRRKATEAGIRGRELFFGKADCASCHVPPYYTDNLVHNLQTERFFKSHVINNHTAIGDGPIKTFPLCGIKDTPPYLHDGRLLTLDDTVEFFNLILELKLTEHEKRDLMALMRQLRRSLAGRYAALTASQYHAVGSGRGQRHKGTMASIICPAGISEKLSLSMSRTPCVLRLISENAQWGRGTERGARL